MRMKLACAAALVSFAAGLGCGGDRPAPADASTTDGAALDGARVDGATGDGSAGGCDRFRFVASDEVCPMEGCSPIYCDCAGGSPRMVTSCSERGCLIEADCDAVCAASSIIDALGCTGTYTVRERRPDGAACELDSQCASSRCTSAPTGGSGVCTAGAIGDPCFDFSDCTVGACQSGVCSCAVVCADVGAECGSIVDGCGGTIECGGCVLPETCGGTGTPNRCGCRATTCASVGANCGMIDDACGSMIGCGACTLPETCGGSGVANRCGCTPLRTCASVGAECGVVDDGCGHLLSCGSCTAPLTCGGGGMPNHCGCTLVDCATVGANCGTLMDGCGGTLSCGSCTLPETCGGGGMDNRCGCTRTTCTTAGANCGALSDGCGGMITCGVCTLPQTCGGGGTPNRCGCMPRTCRSGIDCGSIADGCGGTLSCGGCALPLWCGGGGTTNECGCSPSGTIGPRSPSLFVTSPAIGTHAWTNLAGILASDDDRASAGALGRGEVTNYLVASGFGFAVPLAANIRGIRVEVERSASPGTLIGDEAIRIVKSGAIGLVNRSTGATWGTSDAYASYGGTADLWGDTWSAADINSSDFGVAIAAHAAMGGGSDTPRVDHVRITVYFTVACP